MRSIKFCAAASLTLALTACGGGGSSTPPSPPPPVPYNIGGNVTGLVGTGLVVQLNGGQNMPLATNTGFAWSGALVNGQAYAVTIASQPSASTCTVSNGTGTVSGAQVLNVAINCVPNPTMAMFAGNGSAYGSTDGVGTAARFSFPTGVAVDSTGNVYVADNYNFTIRKITSTGVVSTLAGLVGQPGDVDGTGTAARFGLLVNSYIFGGDYLPPGPESLATDSAGNVYITDDGNYTVRTMTPAGKVSTLATFATGGAQCVATSHDDLTPPDCTYPTSMGVATDSANNVYVADTGTNTIDKITPAGVLTVLAGTTYTYGSKDGPGASASFSCPSGIALDSVGNIYVADTCNNVIRMVSPTGVVSTLAGTASFPGSTDGTGSAARFNHPQGIAVDTNNNVYVTDTGNNTVRKITPAGVVTTVVGVAGQSGFSVGPLPGLLTAPQFLALSGRTLYITTGNGVVVVNNLP